MEPGFRRGVFPFLVAVLGLTLACAALQAQVFVASISGTVKDASGGVVPNASVSIKNTNTGLTRELQTDQNGYYHASGLPLGLYEVRASFAGFKTEVRTGIHLTVERGAVVDFELPVGQGREEIVVRGEAPQVNTTSPALGELVDEKRVRQLPLNGRDLTQLALLQPGVLLSRGSTRDINVGFGAKLSVSGSRPNQNLFVIDGTDANDALNNTPAGAPGQVTGVETIKEFRVSTNTMSAEFGRVAGGTFNIVTKSGTNELHGSAFWFLRNDNLDARNFFDAQKPEFKRNQFGFALGGPILRDKTHFFGSYEGLRERKGITGVAFVPGRAIRSATPGPTGTLITFPGAVAGGPTQTARIATSIVPFLNLFPAPNGPEIVTDGDNRLAQVATFRGVTKRFANEDFLTVRLDHRFSNSDTLFGRYLFSDSEFLLGRFYPDFPNLDVNRRQTVTLGETHVFSGTVVNELRFGFNRTTPAELVPAPPTDLSLIRGRVFGELRVTGRNRIPALTELGTDRTNPKLFFQNLYQVSDTLFMNRGRHGLKVGFLVERFQNNGNSESRTRGRVEFRDVRDFILDAIDSRAGRGIEGATVTSDFARGYRQTLAGFYFQDDVRVLPRFTVFAGVRWEFVTTPQEVNGKVSNQTNAFDPRAQLIVGDPRFASGSTLCCRPLFDNPTRRNFAPRLGLAWDIRGTGKTVLRSGFGLFYEQPLFNVYRNPIFRSLPFVLRARVNVPDADGPGPARPNSVTSLPVNPNIFVATGQQDTEAFQFALRRTYVMQYNLNLQQNLGWDTIVTLAYVGSRGINLFGQGDTNIRRFLPATGAFAPTPPPNPNFARVRTVFQGFSSWYNALQVGVVKHPTHGLTFQGAYTFSRCLDERSGSGGRQEYLFGQARAFDPFNRFFDKGLCDFHVQHNFVLNAIYELPFGPGGRFGSGLSGAAARIVEGWQIAGVLNLASGIPFTPFVDGDPDGDGTDDNTARPDLVGNPNTGTCANGFPVRTPPCWFNDTALRFPAGIRGTLGRNVLLGPPLKTFDFSVVKTTRVTERFRVEFRAEFFNLFNHTNFIPPQNSEDGARVFNADRTRDLSGATIQALGFGLDHPGTSTTSREIQFALKFIF